VKLGGRLVQVWQWWFDVCGGTVYSCDIADFALQQWQHFWEMKKAFYRNCFWRQTKQAHLTLTKTLTLAQTPTLTEDMMKTVLLQVGAQFIFGQGHRTPGIMVISIFSLEISVDQEAPHFNMDSTPITVFVLFFMKVIQLLVTETSK